MSRQLSTAISDGFLAIISLHASLQVLGISLSGFVAFVIIGIAATFGTVRFTFANPSKDLIAYHQYMAWLGSVIGTPYLAAAFHKLENSVFISNIHLASGFALLVLQSFLSKKVKDISTEVVSSAAVLSLIGICLFSLNMTGAIGGACYVIAGLAIGTSGKLHGIPRVDLFHYVLVIANIALMMGLQRDPQPVYYKAS